MNKYDLHMHTHFSKCSNLKPEVILKILKKKGYNGVAITDHHTIKGGHAVAKANKDRDFEVIPGIEVTTEAGDVLVYYAQKDIATRKFWELFDEVKKQDALMVVPHPYRVSTNPAHHFGIPFEKVKGKIDAIEGFNARMLSNSSNEKAQEVANRLKIPQTGGSDGHFFFEVGKGYTEFDGSLRDAIKKGKTKAGGELGFGAIGGLFSFIKRRLP